MKTLLTSVVRTSLFSFLCLGTYCNVSAQGLTHPDSPRGYPSSLINARSTYTVSPSTPVTLGNTVVVLESSRLMDVAAIARAPVHQEGVGEDKRSWVCIQAYNHAAPIRLWFIASGQDTVTEAQMSPGTFQHPEHCGRLSEHFEPVHLSRITSGMSLKDATKDIGPSSYKDASGWHFWVAHRSYRYYETAYTEYSWLGAKVDAQGIITEVFTTQITR